MKKFFGEFKTFVLRGNVLDLAVAVIIGAAFQAIVKSLVDDIISPVLGLIMAKNLDALLWKIPCTEVELTYGKFISAIINFIIMAFVIFLIVKLINKLLHPHPKKEAPPAPPTTKECPFCHSTIHIDATRCPNCTSQL